MCGRRERGRGLLKDLDCRAVTKQLNKYPVVQTIMTSYPATCECTNRTLQNKSYRTLYEKASDQELAPQKDKLLFEQIFHRVRASQWKDLAKRPRNKVASTYCFREEGLNPLLHKWKAQDGID